MTVQALGNAQQKMPVTGTQFNDVPGIGTWQIFLQNAGHDSRMTHPSVDPPQIAAGTQCGRILRGQNIQYFGENDSIHNVKFIPLPAARRGN
jgi:hypothetical protein